MLVGHWFHENTSLAALGRAARAGYLGTGLSRVRSMSERHGSLARLEPTILHPNGREPMQERALSGRRRRRAAGQVAGCVLPFPGELPDRATWPLVTRGGIAHAPPRPSSPPISWRPHWRPQLGDWIGNGCLLRTARRRFMHRSCCAAGVGAGCAPFLQLPLHDSDPRPGTPVTALRPRSTCAWQSRPARSRSWRWVASGS